MSLIKKLDDISGTEERSKTLTEAINKVADKMEELKGTKKVEPKKEEKTTSRSRSKGEAEEA